MWRRAKPTDSSAPGACDEAADYVRVKVTGAPSRATHASVPLAAVNPSSPDLWVRAWVAALSMLTRYDESIAYYVLGADNSSA